MSQQFLCLTHLPLDDIFKCIFVNENVCISIWISLKCVAKGSIDNKLIFVQVMVWNWTGKKPLHEPVLTQFIAAYIRH